MKLLTKLLRWLGISVEIERTGNCVVCAQGPNPVLGVPIPTTQGTWKHFVCMTVGHDIAQAAERANADATAPPTTRELGPVIVAIVRPAGREIWN